jgi:predicted metal-dependent hydrolase
VIALWAWHAAEEAEHKATCFDIYQTADGGYFRRVTIMLGSWSLILGVALLNTFILLGKDKRLFSWDTLKGFAYLFGRKGLITGLAPAFFAYFSPRFHPWKEDNSRHIREWEQKNASYIVQRSAPAA